MRINNLEFRESQEEYFNETYKAIESARKSYWQLKMNRLKMNLKLSEIEEATKKSIQETFFYMYTSWRQISRKTRRSN